jgi:Flp pilus assembly protein TadB
LTDAFNFQGLAWRGVTLFAVFATGAALSLAGLRSMQARLDGVLGRYTATLGAAAARSRILDDVGFLGVIAGRLAFGSRGYLTSTVLIAATLVVVTLGILTHYLMLAFMVIGLLFAIPFVVSNLIDFVIRRRTRMIEEALPDATTLIGSALSAGLTLQSALAGVALHMKGPLATEARIASNEIAAGAGVREALQSMVERTPSNYLALFAAAVSLHVERGGNLPEALREMGSALTRIILAEAEVTAKTAGSRREILWATLVPFVIMPVAFLMLPDMVGRLFTTIPGQIILAIAIGIWIVCMRGLQDVSHREV